MDDNILYHLNSFWDKFSIDNTMELQHISTFLNFDENESTKNFCYDSYLLFMYPLIYKNNKLLNNFDLLSSNSEVFIKYDSPTEKLIPLNFVTETAIENMSIDENKIEELNNKLNDFDNKLNNLNNKITNTINTLEKRMIEFTKIVLNIVK